MFLNTFLEILGVIGIVAVSAFVIIFLFDLFISIVDGSNGIFFKRHKNDKDYENSDRPKLLNEPEEKEEVKEEPAKEELAKEEIKEAVKEAVKEAEEEKKEEVVEEEPAEEPAKEEVKEEPAVEEEDPEAIISSITQETKKELAHIEQEEKLSSENENLNKMIEELRAQIEKDKQAIKELEEKVANAPASTEVVTEKLPADSKEEILARLEVLKQRLKENEKELSANKKEFVPLRKVNNTLEKDKKKLRRKEAIVAKQRTVLFGVNNYMEIDNEKAKELDEELELLEGLKLSVQHCEDVMEKNKERYPILERANAFLVKTRDDLRADIKELEDKLALIESEEQNEGADEEAAESNE